MRPVTSSSGVRCVFIPRWVPEWLEHAVSACLHYELTATSLHVEHQVQLPVVYRSVRIPTAYRVDFSVENCVSLKRSVWKNCYQSTSPSSSPTKGSPTCGWDCRSISKCRI